MNQDTKIAKNQANTDKERESFPKAITLTAGVGGSFGLLFTVIVASLYGFPKPVLPYFIGIPVFCTLVSSFSGILGVYINRFLVKLGIPYSLFRQIVEIIIVVTITMTLSLFIASYLGFFHSTQLTFVTTMAVVGFIFGLIVTLIDYRFWKMQQQVFSLEIKNKYLTELAEKEKQLQETTKNLIIAEERNRMARELHDSISQGIHGIIYAIHSLRQHLGTEDQRAGEILDHLEKTSNATLCELKAMIMELKPLLLEEQGLAEALKIHCELFSRRLMIKLNLQIGELAGLTLGQEMAIYRIVQEALANIQQHAGADWVGIAVVREKKQLKLTIQDNGKGFDSETIKRGNGLNNMETRCWENGGTLKINTKPGAGTFIEATFSIVG